MHWREEGVILSVRRHGENGAIVELFTREHGRYLGLVHGARSRLKRPVLQPGNVVDATWRARLSEQLGTLAVEPVSLKAGAFMEDAAALDALLSMVALTQLVPEREAHPRLYDASRYLLEVLDDPALWPPLMVRWELGLLQELGFGLDLTRCAGGGPDTNLAFVSPRSGRAVSAEMGGPYANRMLRLPGFLRPGGSADYALRDITDGFALTGYFLARHILAPRGMAMPQARLRMVSRWSGGEQEPGV
ncbi:DNA repair protein RecO [Rhodoligotrophos defluvii]|uniref:DNA repair protein RecO n=1 Tax=Rhodoligotrophos defluvii TaxID=2561934 RepID=UPI0010C9F74A|nr:DNA repair protein RecO [Rhodoligotrophos defluvii]